jgi:hypothetical protein
MIYSAQAAAALLGQGGKTDQILIVMRAAWRRAQWWHRECLNPWKGEAPPPVDERALQTAEMLSLESGSRGDAIDWYDRNPPFEEARFTSEELERWRCVMAQTQGIESQYFAVGVECAGSSDSSDQAAAQGGAGGNKNTARWTQEFKAEVAAYRAVHGTAAAAKKFDISTGRIRQMLPVRGNATPNAFQALIG